MNTNINRRLLLWVLIIIVIVVVVWLLFQNKFGTPACETTQKLFKKVEIKPISQNDKKSEYKAYNPSVVKVRNGFLYTYRVSNFTNCKSASMFSNPFTNVKLTAPTDGFDSKLMIKYEGRNAEIKLAKPVGNSVNCSSGLEDVRPIVIGDQVILTGSMRTGRNCMSEMWLAKLSINALIELVPHMAKHTITLNSNDAVKLRMTDPNDTIGVDKQIVPEKNWMPFEKDGALHFVYSVNPHIVLRCNLETGDCAKIAESYNEKVPKTIRGGGQVKYYKGQWLGIGHTRQTTNSYVSHFYTFSDDDNFTVTGVTPPFAFDDQEDTIKTLIQFAAGLEFREDTQDDGSIKTTALVTYGEQDCVSKVCEIPVDEIINRIQKI